MIAAQFPELAGLPVSAFDQGWDNAVMAVGERWLFRFVHRAIAIDGARRELAVLREVGPSLPLPVPRPQFVGRQTDALPWPFWGAERLPGVELAAVLAHVGDGGAGGALDRPPSGAAGQEGRSGWSDVAVARRLGSFLRELHRPENTAVAVRLGLPVDPNGRGDPHRQADRARERIAALRADGTLAPDRAADEAIDAVVEAAASLSAPAEPPVLVHGDLHLRHVLVTRGRVDGVGGVIDWGDTSLADPAVDLMLGFAAFDGDARAAFLESYGQVPPDRLLHARTVALAVTAALTQGAAAIGRADVLVAGLASLARAAR